MCNEYTPCAMSLPLTFAKDIIDGMRMQMQHPYLYYTLHKRHYTPCAMSALLSVCERYVYGMRDANAYATPIHVYYTPYTI